ncbi:MAG TPA: alkaline phosphatase family protein, partial [Candidatus Acidoferrales bacterium]|nr:alkaline phosphatase family protein [Candidatus Acidoferrales bacterium]
MFGHSYRSVAMALAVSIFSACSGAAPPLAQPGPLSLQPAFDAAVDAPSQKIGHVVVIVQENRTFDNMFHGFPGANSADSGKGLGRRYHLQPVSLASPYDLDHSRVQFLEDFDRGKMDGFEHDIVEFAKRCPDELNEPRCWRFGTAPYSRLAYSFVPGFEVKPLWD